MLASDKICPQQGRELRACELSCGLRRAPGEKNSGLRLIPSPGEGSGTFCVSPTATTSPGRGTGSSGIRQGKVICGYRHPENELGSSSRGELGTLGFWVDHYPDFQPCVGWNMSRPSVGLAGRQNLTGICISAVGFKNKTRAGSLQPSALVFRPGFPLLQLHKPFLITEMKHQTVTYHIILHQSNCVTSNNKLLPLMFPNMTSQI